MISEPISNSEVIALFDAQPESILVRRSDDIPLRRGIRVVGSDYGETRADSWITWSEIDRRGRQELERHASAKLIARIRITGSPLSLLFGRNGAGKSRFLNSLELLRGDERGLFSSSVLFKYPSTDDMKAWKSSVFAAKESEWLRKQILTLVDEEEYENSSEYFEEDMLHRIFELPLVNSLRSSLLHDPGTSGSDLFGLDRKSHLELLGFSDEAVQEWEERDRLRWGTNRLPDDRYDSAPFMFVHRPDVRSLAAELYFLYASRMTVALDSGLQYSYGEQWTSTNDWFNSSECSKTVGPAVEEFMREFTHIELISGDLFRFIAPLDSVPDVMKYIKSCDDFVADQIGDSNTLPNLSLPLDMFRVQEGGEFVESSIFRLQDAGLQSNLIDVVDLTFPDSSSLAMTALLSELVAQNLELTVGLRPDQGSSLILQLDGYDNLRKVGTSVSHHVSQCEAGISEVRIREFRRDDSTWVTQDAGETGRLKFYRYFGSDPFEGIPRPIVEWRDSSSGLWFDFDQASLGQRQLMLVFLAVELLLGREKRPPLTVVVGDEIDRNLHWRASSRMLEILNERVGLVTGLWVFFSTHSVPALRSLKTDLVNGSTRLESINQIFAMREGDAFSFVQSQNADQLVVSEILGVSPVEALRLKHLLVVVEGDHDEFVITSKVVDGHPLKSQIHLVNAGGIYAWSGILSNTLQHLDAPILFVYDKWNERLEAEWSRIRLKLMSGGFLPRWHDTDFSKMLTEIRDRQKSYDRIVGDDESKKILMLLKNNIFESRSGVDSRLQPNATLAKRLHFHGLEVDDIVDLLPISSFPMASSKFKSWDDAHDKFPSGERFKEEFGIDNHSVKKALSRNSETKIHSELKRLLERINGLLGTN